MATAAVFSQTCPSMARIQLPDSHSATPLQKTEVSSRGRLDLQAAMLRLEDHTWKSGTHEQLRDHYNSIISLCIKNKALSEGSHLRSHMARHGYEPGVFLDNQFINLYSKCGEINMAQDLFDSMPQKNVVSWNALISGYCSNNCFADALWTFHTMIQTGTDPNYITYLATLQAVVAVGSLKLGKQIHSQLIKSALLACTEVGNALISMYSEFGSPNDGEDVYHSMTNRNEASWNSLISLYVKVKSDDQALALFLDMLNKGVKPNEFTFGSLLTMRDTTIIKDLHGQIIKMRLGHNVFIGSALVDAYARCGNPKAACLVFNSMEVRNRVAWNSVICACFENDMLQEGLQFFLQMGKEGIVPDKCTLSILLKAAATESLTNLGIQLHGLAFKKGLHTDALVANSLITMYANNKGTSDSWRVFNSILEAGLISWNSIIQCYVQNEKPDQAVKLFIAMKHSGFDPDKFSFLAALAACASLAWYGTGREVHCDLIKRGLTLDSFLESALIDMYAKTTVIHDARKVFKGSQNKDLITWNSMIAGLSQNGYLEDVLKLLCRMREEKVEPDHFTFASVFTACANATSTHQGKQLHALILKLDVKTDAGLGNSLITMYCRAGNIREATKVFSRLPTKNVVTWTSMITGQVQGGYPKKAIDIFHQMENFGVIPNDKTFVAVLTACSYAGRSNEAARYFTLMETKYGIRPAFDHYACMVDILGRGGRLEEAECLIEAMPFEPDALVWRMLLSACRIQLDAERGKRAMEKILALEPTDSAAYVLLSNLYASLGNWAGVVEVRNLMRENGVKKEPGKSWIELNHKVHEFLAADCSHVQTDEIYLNLDGLFKQMKDEGYVPGIQCIGGIGKCRNSHYVSLQNKR